MVLFYQTRGCYAYNSLMPALTSQHYRRIYVLLLRQLRLCLLHNFAADFLAQAVFTVQLSCYPFRFNSIIRHQKLYRQLRMLQASHSV